MSAAAHWYRRSAEGGYFRGQYNWATILAAAGRIDAAAEWFERAATDGSAAVREAVIAKGLSPGAPAVLAQLAARLQRIT